MTNVFLWTDAEYLVKKLKNTKVLEGHNGCVRPIAMAECIMSSFISGTYMLPIEAFATAINMFDRQILCLIVPF